MTDADADPFGQFLDAIEAGDAYYLQCPDGHGSVPPRRICPDCHSRDLSRAPLPSTGEIVTYTVVSVPAPRFADDGPYVTAIADFGPVTITGQLRDVEPDSVETGQTVSLAVDAADGDPFVAFERP